MSAIPAIPAVLAIPPPPSPDGRVAALDVRQRRLLTGSFAGRGWLACAAVDVAGWSDGMIDRDEVALAALLVVATAGVAAIANGVAWLPRVVFSVNRIA